MITKYITPLLFAITTTSQALVLEEIIQSGELDRTFENTRLGIYMGSFDPLHKGHILTANLPLEQNLCDYIFVYPNWGGDRYKDRSDISYRQKMLFETFKDNPKIIVTKLPPQDIQQIFSIPSNKKTPEGKTIMDLKINSLNIIGILGSDAALSLSSPEKERIFLQGLEIPEKHKDSTIGGLMMLKANSFITVIRNKDDISSLKNKIGERPILATLKHTTENTLSSTKVRENIKNNHPIDQMLPHEVTKIIQENNLYAKG